ncbi:hypothetical protein [Arundinibacter roseus]|uniref:Uncharacterized protein n=1 Tax=Arundinibacter roseus TaxID=2070510 RepID=A0A4R4K4J8_9BACT|nr:hypothetical protein [Arundinibacter roseus]TDB62357.1 hypothetical protein EZE20_18420 [Arundinibacter roseus]
MKSILLFLPALLYLTSCTETGGTAKAITSSEKTSNAPEKSTDAAKTWLIKAIEGHFNSENFPMEKITTPTYVEYKSDATNVDMDGGLSVEEFTKKWKSTFNPALAGIGTGFLISGQDYGKIKVTSCVLIKELNEKRRLYKVILDDPELKESYTREILVGRNGNSFLIEDVRE